MLILEELAPGYYKFIPMWPAHRGITLTLTLIDSNGKETVKSLVWTPVTDIPAKVAITNLINRIKEIPLWNAVASGNEMSIGVSDPEHHSGTVVMELI